MFYSISLAFACSILYFAFTCYGKWYKQHRKVVAALRHIPGPRALPLIGSAYRLMGVKREDRYVLKQQLHVQFPVIMCQWFGSIGQVTLKRAEHLDKILINYNSKNLQKGWTYETLRPWMGDGLLTSTGDRWHQKRKMVTPAFHIGHLEHFCEVFAAKAEVLAEKLRSDIGEPVQIYPFVTRATLDIIAETAMGTVINAQDNLDHKYVSAVYKASELIVRRKVLPWYQFQFLYDVSSDGKLFAECLRIMRQFTNQVLDDRRKSRAQQKNNGISSAKPRPAFLDLLLDESDKPETNLTDDDIVDELQTFMFAGHDTTSAAIAWVVYLLGRHPDIQEEVYAEMLTIFCGSNRAVTTQDLHRMELLDRIIKETLRIYPSVAFIQRKLSEVVQLDSQYRLPTGCEVSVDIALLHRDPRYFPEPERFDPDRFLPENVNGRPSLAYIPFSAGARNCIGQRFAVYEMKMLLSTLIRRYRIKGVGPDERPVEEIVTKPFHGVKVICEERR